jgi:hypothetical protein
VNNKYTSCGCAFIEPYEDQTLSSQHALYRGYQYGSKLRKLVFDLSFEQFIKITKNDCFYCGSPPSSYYKAACSLKGYSYNGIDRLDNSRGYSPDNIVGCCKICNRAKWTMNKDVFIALIKRCHEQDHPNPTSMGAFLETFGHDPEKERGFRLIYKIYEKLCAKKRNHLFLLGYEEFSNLIQ